jgi:hypothetical protein
MGRRCDVLYGDESGTVVSDTRPTPDERHENIETPDEDTRREIARRLRQERVSPDSIYAFEKSGLMITEENRDLWTAESLRRWNHVLHEFRRGMEADSRAINLCFTLHHESARSELAKRKRFAASEFAIAVLCAHDHGLSSFAVENLFRESWLDYLLRHVLAPKTDRDAVDPPHFVAVDIDALRDLLSKIYDELSDCGWSSRIEARIKKIEAARAQPETWLGRSPDRLGEEETEEIFTIDHLQNAITHCKLEGVPQDVIQSMLLRSWVRMRVLNERTEERFFQVLDKHWDEVHARMQVHMAQHSGLRLQ